MGTYHGTPHSLAAYRDDYRSWQTVTGRRDQSRYSCIYKLKLPGVNHVCACVCACAYVCVFASARVHAVCVCVCMCVYVCTCVGQKGIGTGTKGRVCLLKQMMCSFLAVW